MRPVEPTLANGGPARHRAADGEGAERARRELKELEAAYRKAIERGMSEASAESIAAAFDEADRLQGRLLKAIGRARALERAGEVGDRVAPRAT
jgi:hypothetical protein